MLKHHQLYVPHEYHNKSALPLLIMHDGPEYVEYAGLNRCLDFLIATGRIPPMLALLHQPHSRNDEYVDNAHHFDHLFEEVLPQLTRSHPFGRVYAGGASLGGVASLLAAFRNPGAIDGLILQSGSFVFGLGGPFRRGPVLKPVTEVLPQILQVPEKLPENLVLSCGTYDGLVEDHRVLIPKLRQSRPNLKYAEINAGHHWRCWRDRLESDLFALLSSP
jgi:enterochelin esterase family protein